MNEHDVLAERFEIHRARLRAIAYQVLGSATQVRPDRRSRPGHSHWLTGPDRASPAGDSAGTLG
jgi:hypothetical protein